MKRYGLSKYERIKLRSEVKELFESDRKHIVNVYPLKVLFVVKDAEDVKPVSKIMVSVSHKRIRRAVKRNLVKRRIKEAYRLNKQDILQTTISKGKIVLIAFVYVSSSVKPYSAIETAVKTALQQIISRV